MKRTNKPAKKLTLDVETIRALSQQDLSKVAGGARDNTVIVTRCVTH